MVYCQIVIGAPGSGKSTYCNAMQQFLQLIGRETIIVNIDPANEQTPYECAFSITDLITVDDIMNEFGLGPNGSLIYCMEWLDKNMHLLKENLDNIVYSADVDVPKYILFDFPGQAELYTHNTSMRSIVQQICSWDYKAVAVHLTDSHLCNDPSNFISSIMMSLSVMCHLELPHVNILSKIDTFDSYGQTHFGLDFYTEILDLTWLTEHIDPHLAELEEELLAEDNDYDDDVDLDEIVEDQESALKEMVSSQKSMTRRQRAALKSYCIGHRRLNTAVSELIDDYSMVGFRPLTVNDKYSMHRALHAMDKANGYMFADLDLQKVELNKFKESADTMPDLQVTERMKKHV